ncbi:unnamed protein product [Mycena citricolor]|uniref:DUF6535 domain-containing protein n=1 Tax=Mycena citricolor TaxID=2018698 RepID=A0AAD2HUA6_9AGAR|nr:unnamed protein product [Mycena citricolor]
MSYTERREEEEAQEPWAAPLWTVYVDEAEKYDTALVESWMSDMDGMLIFAGLFSGVLTAFIGVSFGSLSPDSSNTTNALLITITQQLAASATSSAQPPSFSDPNASFEAPFVSIACNALWIISLGFSLTCALLATLVQQWSREFLHKTSMYSAPLVRARIFSFLYYGLRSFRMHIVVEVLPLLLHASMLFFFAGLVAFSLPVCMPIAWIAVVMLGVVSLVYAALTIVPLVRLDCPYRTPLSRYLWGLFHGLHSHWRRLEALSEKISTGCPPSGQTYPESADGDKIAAREIAHPSVHDSGVDIDEHLPTMPESNSTVSFPEPHPGMSAINLNEAEDLFAPDIESHSTCFYSNVPTEPLTRGLLDMDDVRYDSTFRPAGFQPMARSIHAAIRSLFSSWQNVVQIGKRREEAVLPTVLSIETMPKAITRAAMVRTTEQCSRDYRALVWNLNALIEHAELQPFVEAIPDLVWASDTRRRSVYDRHIRELSLDPHVRLVKRISGLFESCKSSLLDQDELKHRWIVCLKAICAIGSVFAMADEERTDGHSRLALEMKEFEQAHEFSACWKGGADIEAVSISARAMMRWARLCILQTELCARESELRRKQELGHGLDIISPYASELYELYCDFIQVSHGDERYHPPFPGGGDLTEQHLNMISALGKTAPYMIMLDYLSASALLPVEPYRRKDVACLLDVDTSIELETIQGSVEFQLDHVASSAFGKANSPTNIDTVWFDESLMKLLHLWKPSLTLPMPISSGIITLLNLDLDDPNSIIVKVLRADKTFERRLWSGFVESLSVQVWVSESILTALWSLASWIFCRSGCDETWGICHSIIPILKMNILDAITLESEDGSSEKVLNHRIFPKDTAVSLPDMTANDHNMQSLYVYPELCRCLAGRKMEARMSIIAEFLERCATNTRFHKRLETYQMLSGGFQTIPRARIHPNIQRRLASAINQIYAVGGDLMRGIVTSDWWDVYAGDEDKMPCGSFAIDLEQGKTLLVDVGMFSKRTSWIDDGAAWRSLQGTFRTYVGLNLSQAENKDEDGDMISKRVKAILAGLDKSRPSDGESEAGPVPGEW